MSGDSSVGTAQVYEGNEQRKLSDTEKEEKKPDRYEEGKENAHKENDSKDERSIKNKLDAADPQNDSTSGKKLTAEDIAAQSDPTAPARMHGNEPSRGAKIDKAIEDEEEEILRKKEEAKKQSEEAHKKKKH